MKIFCGFIFLFLGISISKSQTVGLIQNNTGTLNEGYVLFAPIGSTKTYLIDKCGRQVKTWTSSYRPGQSVYLLPDGNILRPGNVNNTTFNAGGEGGIIEKYDWDGNLIWSYTISDASKCQHHDIEALPNGNVLVIAWEKKTALVAIANGRDPSLITNEVWSEQILEIQPVGATGGNIVWEWHVWDHLIQDFDAGKPNYGVVASNPQLIDLNYAANPQIADWHHMNSIDYNDSLDQILVSSHNFNEIWIIDHSTTTAEAAGHSGGNSGKGGDLLYRWGNPEAYDNGAETDQKFYGQHDAHWIENGLPFEGQIMVFNNGQSRTGGDYSTVEIIQPPLDSFNYNPSLPYLPLSVSWIYNDGNINSFYAQRLSGAQQLSNGNVLICNGPSGNFLEVDSLGVTLWNYINPVSGSSIISQGSTPSQNSVFRCTFYPYNYSGFNGHNISAGNIIEDFNPVSSICSLTLDLKDSKNANALYIFPNPASGIFKISLDHKYVPLKIEVYNALGKKVWDQELMNAADTELNLSGLNDGIYFISAVIDKDIVFNEKILLVK